MMKYAKLIDVKDNVITALSDVEKGEEVTVKFHGVTNNYRCNEAIPFGHKIAILDIPAGERIVKYGEKIGSATCDIKIGDWVHIHNVRDDYKCLGKDGNPLPGQDDAKPAQCSA